MIDRPPVARIPADPTIISYQPASLIGEHRTLSLMLGTRHKMLVLTENGSVIRALDLPNGEVAPLLTLLEMYPAYAPYEWLHAAFTLGRLPTEEEAAKSRRRLATMRTPEDWEYEIRPIRNVLSRVRLKLREWGLEIAAMLETGYMLTTYPHYHPDN